MQSKSDSVKPIRPRRVTASEVAQAAGVSRSAVLRAYMPGALLTPSKKERILRIANKLGFVPDTSEALTQNAPTNLITVYSAGANSEWLEHLCAALTREGKWPIVLTDPDLQQTDSLTAQLGFAVEALVLPAGLHDDWANRVSQQDQIPLIFSGGIERAKEVVGVFDDQTDGLNQLAALLVQTGRRRIALITPDGFVVHVPAALKEAGLGFIATGQTQPTFDGGATAAKTLLDQHDLDAILCMNDEIALGALTVARDEFRLRVPRDLAVVGYGDSAMAAWPCFGLTTMRMPNAEIATKTAQLLLERLEHPERSPETIWVTPEMIERDTH